MKKLSSTEFRQLFLDYFVTKGHIIEPSSSLVPKDDPTLLWINSGVAALKKYFDGSVIPKSRRITNAQKSIRANDIENVGITARHHTFFEMLGNFSIGDYFRPEAIAFAWEFLTSPEWVDFDADKLYVTVYPGDDDTYNVWKDVIGLKTEQIVFCEDNFWEIGEGPCGPCTEIFYDRGPEFNYDTPAEELFVGGENDRWVEIWNVVLSQFDAKVGIERKDYKELPAKNIDTGMGLERMVSIIQGGETNFDTDLFLPIIAKIVELAKIEYNGAPAAQKTVFKLIADHTRTVVFGIADGAMPSNEGRGYVIRRLLRRAARNAKKIGLNEAFLYKLVPVVIAVMKDYYGYLLEKEEMITKVIKIEEEKFLATLSDGEKKLDELLTKASDQILSGEAAFTLYDTYGFPIELTVEIAEEKQVEVDLLGFEKYMDEQKQRARNARHNYESMGAQNNVLQNFQEVSEFVGYEMLEISVQPILILENGEVVESLNVGSEGHVILDKTPFYAESGGQVADIGILETTGTLIEILDVKKAPNGQPLHSVKVIAGTLTNKGEYLAKVDSKLRFATQKNHTATHLLQKALRTILGTHIEQAGSNVDSQRLRFDFTHYEAVSVEVLEKIEKMVNEMIWESVPVMIETTDIETAKAKGAMALFGEKYGDIVRVVTAGSSIELCGGTHVSNTSEIGIFKIVAESGIGSGVRRIEAVTSENAYVYYHEVETVANKIKNELKKQDILSVHDAVLMLTQKNKELTQEVLDMQKAMTASKMEAILNNPILLNKQEVIFAEFKDFTIQELKAAVDIIKERKTSYIACLISQESDKTNIVVAISQDNVKNYQSNDIIKDMNTKFNSRGGGKPEIAQSTSSNKISKEQILEILKNIIK